MKDKNTIKITVEPTLMNPEDFFNDLIEDGCSVSEALNAVIEDELVNAKLADMSEFPSDKWAPVETEDLGGGVYKVVLEPIDWDEIDEIHSPIKDVMNSDVFGIA